MSVGAKTILISLIMIGMVAGVLVNYGMAISSVYGSPELENAFGDESEMAGLTTDMDGTFSETSENLEGDVQSEIGMFKAGVTVTTLMSNSLGMVTKSINSLSKFFGIPSVVVLGIIAIFGIILFFYIFGIFFPGSKE